MPFPLPANKPAFRFTIPVGWGLLGLLWLTLIGLGIHGLWRFEAAPGPAERPAATWTIPDTVALDPARPTVIMLAHPKCPCTRASLAELNRLAALCPGCAAVWVLFLRPPGCSEDWARTSLWRDAAAIPGVHVLEDKNGQAAQKLGAATSGETLVYAPNGRLLFHGGLTGARGQEGDNVGLLAVAALIQGRTPPSRQSPIYGCPLTQNRAARPGGQRCPR